MPSPPLSLNSLRRHLRLAFDRASLTNFCQDYFYEAFASWPSGVEQAALTNHLLRYCQQNPTHTERLLAAIMEEYEYRSTAEPALLMLSQELERLLLKRYGLRSLLSVPLWHSRESLTAVYQSLDLHFAEAEDVRFFCYDTQTFIPLYNHWRPLTRKAVMVRQLVAYADQTGHVAQLPGSQAPATEPPPPEPPPPPEEVIDMTPERLETFQHALLSAYPNHNNLKRMVRFGMDENLDAVAGTGPLTDTIFNLIMWAEAEGRLAELVQVAKAHNRGNPALRAF